MRYSQASRNAAEEISSTTYDIGSMPITALASALASAPPEQQRIVSTSYKNELEQYYLF